MQLADGSPPRALDVSEDLLLAHLVGCEQPAYGSGPQDDDAHRVSDGVVQLAGDAGPFVEDRRTCHEFLLLLQAPGEGGDLHGLVVLATHGQTEDEEDRGRDDVGDPDQHSTVGVHQVPGGSPDRCGDEAYGQRTLPRKVGRGRVGRAEQREELVRRPFLGGQRLPDGEDEEQPAEADGWQPRAHQHEGGRGADARPPGGAVEHDPELVAHGRGCADSRHDHREGEVTPRDPDEAPPRSWAWCHPPPGGVRSDAHAPEGSPRSDDSASTCQRGAVHRMG